MRWIKMQAYKLEHNSLKKKKYRFLLYLMIDTQYMYLL